MGNLNVKVIDQDGKPIPTAQLSGYTRCGACVVNCHNTIIHGSSDNDGIISIKTTCGWGGGTAWGTIEAIGYQKKPFSVALDYWGGDTNITIGLDKVLNTNCTGDKDCPKGYTCKDGNCIKLPHHSSMESVIDWIKKNWLIIVIVILILIVLFIALKYNKGNKGQSSQIIANLSKLGGKVADTSKEAIKKVGGIAVLGGA